MNSVLVWGVYAFLSGLVLLFVGLWISSLYTSQQISTGNFVVSPNIDGVLLQICGPTRDQPCLYDMPTLAQAITQCDVLSDICNQFVYIESSNTMRIVANTGTFSSVGSDLYKRT